MTQNNELRSYQKTLHIVLVLSIIGSGFDCIGSFLWAICMPMMQQMVPALPEPMLTTAETMLAVPRLFYVVFGLLFALSLAGVLMMWKYRRTGFHCYALAQLLVLIVRGFFLGRDFVAIGDIMIVALFIVYYHVTLRSIERLTASDSSSDSGEAAPPAEQDAE